MSEPRSAIPEPLTRRELVWVSPEPLATLGFEPLRAEEVRPEDLAENAIVHVHIDRVEVQRPAPFAPPPAPAARPKRTPALSLDQYLEKRRAGGGPRP